MWEQLEGSQIKNYIKMKNTRTHSPARTHAVPLCINGKSAIHRFSSKLESNSCSSNCV